MLGLLRIGGGSTILHPFPAPVQAEEAQRDEQTKKYVRPGEKIIPGCEYSVPNVMFFALGAEDPDHPGQHRLWSKEIEPLKEYWKNKGFRIRRSDDFVELLGNRNIYGFVYNGHGIVAGPPDNPSYSGAIDSVRPRGLGPDHAANLLHHKLGYVQVIACGSSEKNWQRIISVYGVAKVYNIGGIVGVPGDSSGKCIIRRRK